MVAKLQRAWLWTIATPGTLHAGGTESQERCGCLGGQDDRQQQSLGTVTSGVPETKQ